MEAAGWADAAFAQSGQRRDAASSAWRALLQLHTGLRRHLTDSACRALLCACSAGVELKSGQASKVRRDDGPQAIDLLDQRKQGALSRAPGLVLSNLLSLTDDRCTRGMGGSPSNLLRAVASAPDGGDQIAVACDGQLMLLEDVWRSQQRPLSLAWNISDPHGAFGSMLVGAESLASGVGLMLNFRRPLRLCVMRPNRPLDCITPPLPSECEPDNPYAESHVFSSDLDTFVHSQCDDKTQQQFVLQWTDSHLEQFQLLPLHVQTASGPQPRLCERSPQVLPTVGARTYLLCGPDYPVTRETAAWYRLLHTGELQPATDLPLQLSITSLVEDPQQRLIYLLSPGSSQSSGTTLWRWNATSQELLQLPATFPSTQTSAQLLFDSARRFLYAAIDTGLWLLEVDSGIWQSLTSGVNLNLQRILPLGMLMV